MFSYWIRTFVYFPLLLLILFLQGCASSAISREVEGQVDVGYRNANDLVDHALNTKLEDTYRNTNSTTKGVVIGGTAGALIGSATTGIGLIPGLASGAIIGGAYGAYLDSFTTLRDALENHDVKVIILGDQILLVIPSNRLFSDMTPNIRSGAYETLYLVSRYISTFPNMTVQVSAFTNADQPQNILLSLSQQQAENVAKFLWRTGINTRLLYAQGYGGCKLVERNSGSENSENYRIEITLEKVPV